MAQTDLMKLFHHDVRKYPASEPGYSIISENPVVRLVSNHKGRPFNMVICSELTDENADATIEREISFFKNRNEPFEWKVFGYDQPKDLAERLTIHGFKEGEKEVVVIAEVGSVSPDFQHSLFTFSRIESVERLRSALFEVNQGEAHPEHLKALFENLALQLTIAPETINIYAAYSNKRPVSLGWAFLPPGSQFCGLFGGTTHEEFRKQGLYKKIVSLRAQAAKERGYKYLYVDAGPMSLPILKSLGFFELSTTQGFHFSPF